eukprot:gene1389-11741_t
MPATPSRTLLLSVLVFDICEVLHTIAVRFTCGAVSCATTCL